MVDPFQQPMQTFGFSVLYIEIIAEVYHVYSHFIPKNVIFRDK